MGSHRPSVLLVAFLAGTCLGAADAGSAMAVPCPCSVELRLRQTAPGSASSWRLPDQGTLATPGAVWRCEQEWTPVALRDGCVEGQVRVTLVEGSSPGAAIDCVCRCADWDARSYVLAPAVVYDGNRFERVDVPYSPFWPDASHYAKDKPISVTDQPLLMRSGAAALIELDTGNVATPCLGFRTPAGQGFLLLTDQGDEHGNRGLTIAEDGPARTASFTVTTPRARSRSLRMMGTAAGDAPLAWRAGDSATLRVRLWSFPAPRLQDLFARFAEARKDLAGGTRQDAVPFSAAAGAIRAKLDRLNWDEELGYYRHHIDRSRPKALEWWQLGWVTGGITTLPMLLEGDAAARAHALRNLEFLFVRSPAANGLYNAMHDGTRWYMDDPRPPKPGYQLSVRRQADALFYGLKQVLLLKERHQPVPASWEASLRSLAEALVRVWRQEGQVGQYLDMRSGGILIGGTTAGAILPAGLVLAARQFGEASYLAAAEGLARRFVERDLSQGLTTGGPCDALAAPDSESCFALVTSLVALHEATGRSEWAEASREAIRLFATWVTSHDYRFPPDSPMARAGVHACGSVWANVQNKHGAPGICTASGDALLRHWRATGDPLALELLRDIAHNMTFYVALSGHPVGGLGPGEMCERVNLSDWEGPGAVGGNLFGSVIWAETAMLLTAAEIPGIHVRSDTGVVTVFDHVQAELIREAGRQVLRIRNPTAFAARVSVLVEDARTLAAPLPLETLRDALRVEVAAGAASELELAGTAR